jgi:hypothetical protein
MPLTPRRIILDPDNDPDAPAPHVAPRAEPPPYSAAPGMGSLSADARGLAQDIVGLPPGVRNLILALCRIQASGRGSAPPPYEEEALALAIHYIARTATHAAYARTVWLSALNYVVLAFSTSLLSFIPVAAAHSLASRPLLALLGILLILLLPVVMVGTRFDRRSGSLNGLVWLLAGVAPLVGATLPLLAALGFRLPLQGLRAALAEAVKISAAAAAAFGISTAIVLRQMDRDVKVYWALGVHELPTLYDFVTSIARAGARAYEGVVTDRR